MSTNRQRRRPTAMGIVKDIPARQKNGEWSAPYEQWKASPNEKFGYQGASPSQASYLKGRYGVETLTRNTHWVDDEGNFVSNDDAYQVNDNGEFLRNEKGNRIKREDVSQVCDLYVTYNPDTVEANLAAARKAAEKAKAKAAQKVTGATKAAK